MTWGYENGDSGNCPYYPPICTYEGMQWRLRQSYVEMAELNDGIVSPVGMVWKAIRESNPELDLYQADESHPTDYGTYIAACTFYATLFQKSPYGAYYPEELDETTANLIQNTAWNVVTDSLDTWLIDTTTLRVDFEPVYTTKSVYANFENYTENADSCLWVFGDGQTEWQYPSFDDYFDIMSHEYAIEDEYEICLKAYKGCETKQVCKIRYIWASEISKTEYQEKMFYPNPISNGILYTPGYNNIEYEIFSIDGKLLKKSFIRNNSINFINFSDGYYLLKMDGKSFRINVIN